MSRKPSPFGARLAEKRKAVGLTQEQLGAGLAADGGDVGKGAVSSWEVGRTVPSATQIPKLCERLKCSADDLLGMKRGKAASAPKPKAWDGKERRTVAEAH